MRSLKRLRRGLVVATALAGIMMFAATSSAMAVPTWSPSNQGMAWTGSIKIFKNGGSEKTCTFEEFSSNNTVILFNPKFTVSALLPCTGGTNLQWTINGEPLFETSYKLRLTNANPNSWFISPYGNWTALTATVPFTNGSGLTPSHITFEKTVIGELESHEKVTATGTVNVTTAEGGLITLSGK